MTVKQSPTPNETTAARSTGVLWLAGKKGRIPSSPEAANDNLEPPLPPAVGARWPRVFPGL